MRLLADSTVWIDLLRGTATRQAEELERAIRQEEVVVGDLVLAEVMRGISSESLAQKIAAGFEDFDVVELCGKEVALAAARNYRRLRSLGITVRGTVDLVIGAWCILTRTPLLHADRDFAAMEQHLGLRSWLRPH